MHDVQPEGYKEKRQWEDLRDGRKISNERKREERYLMIERGRERKKEKERGGERGREIKRERERGGTAREGGRER